MTDLYELGALELAERIESRELSPVEVVHAVQRRLDETEPMLNAFISRTDEQALADAMRAEQEIMAGRYRGPLHGVPVAIKDNIAVAGTITTAGAKFLRDHRTSDDAEAVRRLKVAGAIVVGKTNMFELAAGSRSANPHFGDCVNPWGPDHCASGSSGGSAIAVAARQVPLSLGTDAAGSVRMPASVTGIVGVKQTHGRVSARGLVASQNVTVDHIGPMARTVADAALLLEAMAGYDPSDPHSANRPVPAYRDALRTDLDGLRIGVPTNYYFDLVAPDVERGVRTAIEEMEGLGATVVPVEIPDLEAMIAARWALSAEGLALHDPYLRAYPGQYSRELRRRLYANYFISGRDVARANRVRRLAKDRFAAVLEEVDLLATPTTPVTAMPLSDSTVTLFDALAEQTVERPIHFLMLRLTAPGNLTGFPSISVPAGFSSAGLPIGLQLTARPFAEELMFGAAHAYEQVNRWYTRTPTLLAAGVAA